jgi:hypothetical protein
MKRLLFLLLLATSWPSMAHPTNPGTVRGFDPQPDPPCRPQALYTPIPVQSPAPGLYVGNRPLIVQTGGPYQNPGVTHGFNPQPDPPGRPVFPQTHK